MVEAPPQQLNRSQHTACLYDAHGKTYGFHIISESSTKHRIDFSLSINMLTVSCILVKCSHPQREVTKSQAPAQS